MIRHIVVIRGQEVAYWVKNPEATNTILMIHGFRGNHKGLEGLLPYLEGYRLILPDLPGYGVSAPMKYKHNFTNYSRFLELFCAQLELDQVYLWGHSYGASICIVFAADYPKLIRKLILVSPALPTQGPIVELAKWYYRVGIWLPSWAQRPWLANSFVDRISGRLLIKIVSRRRKAELLAAGHRNLKELNPQVVIETFLSYFKTPLRRRASEIIADTLLVGGIEDILVPPKLLYELQQIMPNAKLVMLPKIGHLSPLEEPGTVATLTKEFITGETLN